MSKEARATELLEFMWSEGGSEGDLTLSDTANTNKWHGLYIGTGGDVKVTKRWAQDQTFKNVPSGTFLPISVSRVYVTGTTASNILGMSIATF